MNKRDQSADLWEKLENALRQKRYLQILKELGKNPEKNAELIEAIKKKIADYIDRNTPPQK